jgi:peptide/nickel transport system ATP-binding protein
MFEACDIEFAWPHTGQKILAGVSLAVAAGDILGIGGPSGSGKTTLARILGGYLAPNSGTIRVDGAPLPDSGTSPVQVVFQHAELAVNPRWKVGRVLCEGWSPDAATLSRFGIRRDWLERYPHELSGGELQRVAIARALVPDLKVLIADELTVMHDAISQARLWRAVLETAQQRRFAIIAIAHDAALLAALGARIMELDAGRLVRA